MRARLGLATTAVLFLAAAPCAAHERSTSYSSWTRTARGADVTLHIAERELTRLPYSYEAGREQRLAEVVSGSLSAWQGGARCAVVSPALRLDASASKARVQWRVVCGGDGLWELRSELSGALAIPHQHFARVYDADGAVHEVLLHPEHPQWQLTRVPASRAADAMKRGFVLGLEHILTGYDHLAFVLGLLLGAAGIRELAGVVTGFTVAHSLTLGLAVAGFVRPSGYGIEIMIAFSIAVLAIENLLRARRNAPPTGGQAAVLALLVPALLLAGNGAMAPALVAGMAVFSCCYLGLVARSPAARRLRWLVAFAFGLLHGFGFAGALVEAEYSSAAIAATLGGFNVGVEAGQLAVVAVCWPVARYARRRLRDRYEPVVLEPASAALLAASTFWYVTRTFA